MNYADEATRFLDEANEAERDASWHSDRLLARARRDAPKRFPHAENMDVLIDIAHDTLKAESRGYQKAIGTNQWMLQKAQINFLAALVHGHTPTDQYDRARSK